MKLVNSNTRISCEIFSKLTIKTQERCQWYHSCVFIVNFDWISYLFLLFLFLDLSGKCPLWYHRRHICVRKNILHLILPCEQGRNFFMFSGHCTIHLIEFDFLKSASCTVLGKFPPWKIPTQKILTHQTLPWKVLPTPDNYHPENSHAEYSDPFH